MTQLVWFEMCGTMDAAITREKQIKAWKRDWKIQLIEKRQCLLAGFLGGYCRVETKALDSSFRWNDEPESRH